MRYLIKNILKYTVIALLLAVSAIGCNSNIETDYDLIYLRGTKWKLAGISHKIDDVLRELEPKGCMECYTLVFDTDSSAVVYSVKVILNLNLLNLPIDISLIDPDEIWIQEETSKQGYVNSIEFRQAIISTKSYEVTKSELKLFFDEYGNYLLFKLFKTE